MKYCHFSQQNSVLVYVEHNVIQYPFETRETHITLNTILGQRKARYAMNDDGQIQMHVYECPTSNFETVEKMLLERQFSYMSREEQTRLR